MSSEVTCAFPRGGESKSQNPLLIPNCSSCLAQLEVVFTAVLRQVLNVPGESPLGEGELVARGAPSLCSLQEPAAEGWLFAFIRGNRGGGKVLSGSLLARAKPPAAPRTDSSQAAWAGRSLRRAPGWFAPLADVSPVPLQA